MFKFKLNSINRGAKVLFYALYKPAGAIGHAPFAVFALGGSLNIGNGVVGRGFGFPVAAGDYQPLAYLQIFNS